MVRVNPLRTTLRVLVIDDDDVDALRLSRSARKACPAAQIDRCRTGDEAMVFLRSVTLLPDIVFLDLSMPGMLGREVLGEIRADGRLRTLTVVVLSGSHVASDVANAYALGAAAYITKQAAVDDLDNVIQRFWLGGAVRYRSP